MKGRAARLQVVLQQSEAAERRAAQAFEAARSYLEAEQQKLEELRVYQADYQSSFASARISRASEIARQRAFLQKLSDAVTQQTGTVSQVTQVLEQKRSLWHKAHLKYKAMANFVHNAGLEEAKALDRKEEKMLDEWTAAKCRANPQPKS